MLQYKLPVLLSGFAVVSGTTAEDERVCDVDEVAAAVADRTSVQTLCSS